VNVHKHIKVNADVRKTIRKYLSVVKKRYPIQKAYLFGSHVTGRAHAWSDIDLALVSTAFAHDPVSAQYELMKMAVPIDWRIEPHVFAPDDFEINHPLVPEINRASVLLLERNASKRVR
jgi:predicted nucleotidyltransferase